MRRGARMALAAAAGVMTVAALTLFSLTALSGTDETGPAMGGVDTHYAEHIGKAGEAAEPFREYVAVQDPLPPQQQQRQPGGEGGAQHHPHQQRFHQNLDFGADSAAKDLVEIQVVAERLAAYAVVFAKSSTPAAIREAVAAAVGLAPGTFGLTDEEGTGIAISAETLEHRQSYLVVNLQPSVAVEFERQRKHLPARKPRVVVCTISTGRYHSLGIKAAATARRFFGADCDTEFFLLSDRSNDIPEGVTHRPIKHREWPFSGLHKFSDMLEQLGDEIARADYFYFIDADLELNEPILLGDIAGDLVGVQHPMYPRFHKAFCATDMRLCRYTFDRNKKSHAYVPAEFDKQGPDFSYANWWYLQSAFWGGKAPLVKWALEVMADEVEKDIAKNVMSKSIQDERYVNHFFWKQRGNASLNLRVLHYSYLYPGPRGAKGHGDWLHKMARPIVIHVDKSMGHLPVGELEIVSVGKRGQCLDPYLGGGQIGLFGCHHMGDTQAWFYTKDKPQLLSDTKRLCMDMSGLRDGDPIILRKCDPSALWQIFDHTADGLLKHRGSPMCAEIAVAKDKSGNMPLLAKACDPANRMQQWKLLERTGA